MNEHFVRMVIIFTLIIMVGLIGTLIAQRMDPQPEVVAFYE
jgi:hypothetical protein